MSRTNAASDIFSGLADTDGEKSKMFGLGGLSNFDALPRAGSALDMDLASGVWRVDSGSTDAMSDGTGSAQFGRVDSGSWEKDISHLVFMKSGIPPPSGGGAEGFGGGAEATSFWKLQDSTETAGNSGMFDSADASINSLPAASAAVASAAASSTCDSTNAATADSSHAMDSPEHLLLERDQPARAFRSVAAIDSAGSVASMLEPRDRNSGATEFRSSSGTDLQGRMSMTSVSERTSTGSYATVNSVASSASGSSNSDGNMQPPASEASGGKQKQAEGEAERRRRRGPNYKPLDELRLFGKVMSTAIQSVMPDAIKTKLPHYFRKGNAFAVANGAHRATVEREIFDVIRPIVFEAFTPPAVLAATRDKLEQLLSEVWWAPAAGMPSPFEQRYEGFGCDMAVAVLNLFQVPSVVVNRATESAVQKSRKASTAAVGGGAAVAAKAGDSSSGGSPSPDKSELPAPAGKPKRVRPVSSGSSPATSLVVASSTPVVPKPVHGVAAVPSVANVSRPRSKKLLQSGRCFAVCAFDTTVPVPLRVAVSNYDALLVAIHNQFFLGFSQPDHLQLSTLTLDGEVAYTRAHFDASSDQSSSTCVILNASCSEVSDSLPIWSLESQCFFWVREYEGDKCPVLDMLAFAQQEQFFPGPSLLLQRQCVYVPLARLKFFGASMSQHRGVDLTMIIKISMTAMPLIASVDCPVSIKLYPHPDVYPKPPVGQGFNIPTTVLLCGYRSFLSALSVGYAPGMSTEQTSAKLSHDAACLLQKNAQEQNQDPTLQLSNVYADSQLGCIQFDVAHWTIYGSSERSPKLQPQVDDVKSFVLQDVAAPDAPRELDGVRDWEHLTELLNPDSISQNQAVMYFDTTFNQWMRAFSWDDLDDGDSIMVMAVRNAGAVAEDDEVPSGSTVESSTSGPESAVSPNDHVDGKLESLEASLSKRNHSFPYLWAPRRCILDAGSKTLRYAGPQGDRRSSGERKPSGETAVAAELKEICIPLRDARVSLDDDALAFAVNIPPGVAKHCEFKFRCADAAELQEWYGTLARLCSSVPPPSSVDVLETALEALQVGPSSATAASLSAEAHGFDLVSRSLPAKLDVSSHHVSVLDRPKSTSSIRASQMSAVSLRLEHCPRNFAEYEDAQTARIRQRERIQSLLAPPPPYAPPPPPV